MDVYWVIVISKELTSGMPWYHGDLGEHSYSWKCADVLRGEGLRVQGRDVCSLLSSGWANIQTNELNCFNREREIVACGNNW